MHLFLLQRAGVSRYHFIILITYPLPEISTHEPITGMNSMEPVRLLIVDNNLQFHDLINGFFKHHDQYVVIGNALSGNEGLRLASQLKPDVILLDVHMEDTNGIEMIPRFHKALPEVRIIMLTIYDIDIYRQHAKAAGAKGYVLKGDIFNSLIPAIEQSVSTSLEYSTWECT